MKKYSILTSVFLLVYIVTQSSCTAYKTVEMSNTDTMLIQWLEDGEHSVFLQNNYSNALYRLDSLEWNDSIFWGHVQFTLTIHEANEKSFAKKKKKEERYNVDPLKAIHIVLDTDSMIKEGYFEAPLSSVKYFAVHDKAKGASFFRSFGVVIVAVAIAAGFGLLIFINIQWS